jgi:membrane-associated protease RseP (regulator of RpoE activity)
VPTLSFGFGPNLLSYQGPEVEYSLRAIPLGGFVAFPDDDPDCPYPEVGLVALTPGIQIVHTRFCPKTHRGLSTRCLSTVASSSCESTSSEYPSSLQLLT